jgi:hypothetical protein
MTRDEVEPPRARTRNGYGIAVTLWYLAVVVARDGIERSTPRRTSGTIERRDALGGSVEVQREHVAAEPGGWRLGDMKDRVHGDGRIRRTAAGTEDRCPGFTRETLAGGHHATT